MSKDGIIVSIDGIALVTVGGSQSEEQKAWNEEISEFEENYDDLEGTGQTHDCRPIFEPGFMNGYPDFRLYFYANVLRPLIQEKEMDFARLLQEIKQSHTQVLDSIDYSVPDDGKNQKRLDAYHKKCVGDIGYGLGFLKKTLKKMEKKQQ